MRGEDDLRRAAQAKPAQLAESARGDIAGGGRFKGLEATLLRRSFPEVRVLLDPFRQRVAHAWVDLEQVCGRGLDTGCHKRLCLRHATRSELFGELFRIRNAL